MSYKDTKSYQDMNDSQKAVLDEIDKRGFRKYVALNEVEEWKEKRANMTPEELEEMKQKDELDKWTGKWMLIGIGVVLFVICTLLIIGEVTGNPLVK